LRPWHGLPTLRGMAEAPEGLRYLPDFLTEEEEQAQARSAAAVYEVALQLA